MKWGDTLLRALLIRKTGDQTYILDNVTAADFKSVLQREAFSCMVDLFRSYGNIDAAGLHSMLMASGNESYLTKLVIAEEEFIPTEELVRIVRHESLRREVKSLAAYIEGSKDPKEALKGLSDRVNNLMIERDPKTGGTDDTWEEILRYIEMVKMSGKKSLGTPTPFGTLNDMTSGMVHGHLWVIGGYTSHGKSSVSNEIIYHALMGGRRVVVFSTEMNNRTVLLRLVARAVGMPVNRILLGDLPTTKTNLVQGTLGLFKEAGLKLYDDVYDIDQMRFLARKDKGECGGKLDIVVIDFIQNVGVGPIYERMSAAAIGAQKLSRELDTCVLVLSQVPDSALSDETYAIRYKGAGEIAAAADVGLWLAKKEDHIKIDLKKHRHGPTGTLYVRFINDWTALEETAAPVEGGKKGSNNHWKSGAEASHPDP